MLLKSYELFNFMHISNLRNFQIKIFWFVLIFQIYKKPWERNAIKIEQSIFVEKKRSKLEQSEKKLNENFKNFLACNWNYQFRRIQLKMKLSSY